MFCGYLFIFIELNLIVYNLQIKIYNFGFGIVQDYLYVILLDFMCLQMVGFSKYECFLILFEQNLSCFIRS